ncbi:GvpL/GvpF family gas vesicle protein [bacterium]|nr:GvpL/GvpF family gas vesicle protein [bacterium]
MSPNEPLYVYCVSSAANGSPSLGPIGIGERGDEVRTVASDGIGLVVSRSPRIPFAEIPPQETLRHLAAHQRVIEQVMKHSTVVPVKLGTYAAGEADVLKILRDNHSGLEQALARFDGTIELDVVVTWPDLTPVFQEIAKEEAVQRLRAEIATLPQDQAFQQRIKLGELVKERLDARRRNLAEQILEGIRDLARAVSVNDLKDDSMILNVALLLERSAEGELDARVGELDERYDGALNFRCVGPLPPYSFGTAELRKIDAETLDAARSTLELPRTASFNEVKQAHRRLAQRCHPDKDAAAAAAARLREAGAAFKVLEQYCHNVKHPLARGECPGLAVVEIRKLSELQAAAMAAS